MLTNCSLHMSTYLIHVKQLENSSCQGVIFDPLNQRYYQFTSLSHLILSLDTLCELNNCPPGEHGSAFKFPDHILQPLSAKPHGRDICSFPVEILYRQHNSIQGRVSFNLTANKLKALSFRSELELMLMIHSYCTKQSSLCSQPEP